MDDDSFDDRQSVDTDDQPPPLDNGYVEPPYPHLSSYPVSMLSMPLSLAETAMDIAPGHPPFFRGFGNAGTYSDIRLFLGPTQDLPLVYGEEPPMDEEALQRLAQLLDGNVLSATIDNELLFEASYGFNGDHLAGEECLRALGESGFENEKRRTRRGTLWISGMVGRAI